MYVRVEKVENGWHVTEYWPSKGRKEYVYTDFLKVLQHVCDFFEKSKEVWKNGDALMAKLFNEG